MFSSIPEFSKKGNTALNCPHTELNCFIVLENDTYERIHNPLKTLECSKVFW